MSSPARRARLAGAFAAVALVAPSSGSGQPQFCFGGGDDVGSPCPDLTVEVAAHRFLDDTRRLELTIVVTNRGSAGSEPAELEAVAPGWDPVTGRVPELGSDGGSAEVPLELAVPDARRGQTDTFVVTVDPANRIEEATEDNNSGTREVEVPVADLAVTLESSRFVDGASRLELVVVVENEGTAPSPGTRIEAVASGWETASEDVAAIAPEGTARAVLAFDVPAERRGRQERFAVTVDPGGDVLERNRENNTLEVPVAVPAPDLAVGSPTSREIDGGERLELTVVVTNLGRAPSPETVVEATAPGWGTARANVGGLAPEAGETVAVTFEIADELRGRRHPFVVTVDPDGEVQEADEDNNSVRLEARIAAVAEPPVEEEGSGFPTGIVLAAVAALIAVAAAGVLVARALRSAPDRSVRRTREDVAARLPRPPSGTETGSAPPPAAEPPSPAGEDWAGSAPTQPLEPPPAGERVVSTGFAPQAAPEAPVGPNTTLACAAQYYFWLEVGEPVAGSIETAPVGLPVEQLPAEARLTVALFAPDGDVSLAEGADLGELRLTPDGEAVVERQPSEDVTLPADSELRLRRLFFRLRTPEREGAVQLRCNVYYEQLLVQSRLVHAQTTRAPQTREGALTSIVDYTLAPRLDPALLAAMPRHRLSLLLNRNGDGTHGLSFLGEETFKSDASFDGLELQDLIQQARGALRRAAWGDEEPWQEGKVYLYERPAEGQLETDLIRFAIRGFRFYAAIIDRLAGGPDDADALARLMEKPGLVQIASKESPRHLLPASLIYDRIGFDTTARFGDYTHCPEFLEALEADAPLEQLRCFQGDCPSNGAETVVCPSGFWGYRHLLGMPVSVTGAPDAPAEIVSPGPSLAVAVSTDPAFTLRAAHEQALRALREGLAWSYAATRADAIRLMKETKAEVVYFYCHGGLEQNVPFIQVGPLDERGITADFLLSQRIRWDAPRPLVFINGCRTTALEPEQALELVSVLVRRAQASGVIGTEITIFEPLARAFAEECLGRFLAGATIGEAVRSARLALLKARNPLGLAYIPFVLAGLRIAQRAQPAP